MSDDKNIAVHSLHIQARAKDYALLQIPGYMLWSERKAAEGESPAFIAHLDATSMFLLPEEVATITEYVFEEMLADLKETIGE